jgi:hypothetical protein
VRVPRSPFSQKTSKSEVLRTARELFGALAPRFVKHGVTSSEVESLLRSVLVHEAARVSRSYGRRPNASQVSIKTGVDRHIVSGLLKASLESPNLVSTRRDPTGRVLKGWASDRAYLSGNRPRALSIGDPHSTGRTAWSLVRRYAPGVWPRLVIDELIRLNYVDVLPKGLLRYKSAVGRAIDRTPINAEWSSRSNNDISRSLVEFLLHRQRGTWQISQNVQIGLSKAPLVRKLIRSRLDGAFAELAEELGSTRWRPKGSEKASEVVVGVTAFTFERSAEESWGHGASKQE